MELLQILVLAVVQGVAELLPVSSSAHVIVAEKLMGLDPTSPEMTFLLVMLHTGTMFAVIAYFWPAWRRRYFASWPQFVTVAKAVVAATLMTGILGFGLKLLIEKVFLAGSAHSEIEHLFGNAYVMASGLTAAGLMIVLSARNAARGSEGAAVGVFDAALIGLVQGICLPFRGFSRSGATISTGLFLRLNKERVEEFSFALAVVLTPAVIVKEAHRLFKANAELGVAGVHYLDLAKPALVGMVFSFLAGLIALRWLSRWLESGRWNWFGYYCFFAAAMVLFIERNLV